MSYATQLVLLLTTWESFEIEFTPGIREIVDRHRERLEAITLQFLQQGVSPAAVLELETAMAEELRELGREWVEMLMWLRCSERSNCDGTAIATGIGTCPRKRSSLWRFNSGWWAAPRRCWPWDGMASRCASTVIVVSRWRRRRRSRSTIVAAVGWALRATTENRRVNARTEEITP
jgi:hypothetical protein